MKKYIILLTLALSFTAFSEGEATPANESSESAVTSSEGPQGAAPAPVSVGKGESFSTAMGLGGDSSGGSSDGGSSGNSGGGAAAAASIGASAATSSASNLTKPGFTPYSY